MEEPKKTNDIQLQLSEEQNNVLIEFTKWVTEKAPYYSRKDTEFLVMFLRACDFKIELTITTLTQYYECKRKLPNWCTNIRVTDENAMLMLSTGMNYFLKEVDDHLPAVTMSVFSRPDQTLGSFDDHIKSGYSIHEVSLRRKTCQNNGLIWVLDCRNSRLWYTWHLLSITFARNFINVFYISAACKMQKVLVLHPLMITKSIFKLLMPFLDEDLKNKVVFCNDWSELHKIVPLSMLPEEYGGTAGPEQDHIDASVNEVLSYRDHFEEDDIYGYQRTPK
ncbi:hypothetical protein CHUAL_001125 [Chamberlinius hualienensis]